METLTHASLSEEIAVSTTADRPRSHSIIGAVVLLVMFVPGCKSSREHAIQETLAVLNEITTLLNAITNDASAREAMPKLRKLLVRLRELTHRLDRQADPQRGEKEDPVQKYRRELEDATTRFRAALAKVERNPEAAPLIQEVLEQESPIFPQR